MSRSVNPYVGVPDKHCPYCGELADIIDSKAIYRTVSYGLFYICRCQPSWVYSSVDSNATMANRTLRELRKKAHKIFDRTWRSRSISRSKSYKFLSIYMGKEGKDCHIAMFNEEECKKVITLVEQPQWWQQFEELI